MTRGNKQVSCIKCRRLFKSKAALNQHYAAAHTGTGKRNDGRRSTPQGLRPRAANNNRLAPVNNGRIPNMTISNQLRNNPMMSQLTPGGQDFFMRALHPNDETRGGGVIIPDQVTIDRAVAEFRSYSVLAKPDSLAAGNWDVQLLFLPLPDMPFVWRAREAGGTWPTAWRQLSELNANRPGTFTLAEAPASPATPGRTPDLLVNTTQFRQAFRGVTVVMNSSSLTNQGFVTAGQWGNKPRLAQFLPYNDAGPEPDTLPDQNLDVLVFEDVPDEVGDIIQLCPEAGQWEAKKGIYMPLRYEDPVHIFNGGAETEWRTNPPNQAGQYVKTGYPVALLPASTTGGTTIFARYLVREAPLSPNIFTSAGSVNQTFGCVIFSGIDATTQLVMHTRAGLETVPVPESPAAAYIQKNIMEDETAIKAVTAVSARLPVVFEHKFNSLGLLLPWLGKAAAAVLPSVAPWLVRKAGQAANWINSKLFPRPKPRYIEEDVD